MKIIYDFMHASVLAKNVMKKEFDTRKKKKKNWELTPMSGPLEPSKVALLKRVFSKED